MKIFKNKFFIICLCVAVFMSVLTATLTFTGAGGIIRGAVNLAMTPVNWCAGRVTDAFTGFKSYFSGISRLYEENQQLKGEIESMKGEINEGQFIREENDRLKDYIGIKESHEDFTLIEGTVISTQSESYMTVITLNRGSGDGVKLGMPVITTQGVVGSVSEVSYASCKVRTIIEASAGVGVYNSRTGQLGIVKGDISYKGTGNCLMVFDKTDADVKEGDLIYTSGTGTIYPRNLLVGRVESVEVNEYSRQISATVSCSVDMSKLTHMLIITEFKIYTGEEETTSEGGE